MTAAVETGFPALFISDLAVCKAVIGAPRLCLLTVRYFSASLGDVCVMLDMVFGGV